jgi:hypothetical protein
MNENRILPIISASHSIGGKNQKMIHAGMGLYKAASRSRIPSLRISLGKFGNGILI